MLPIKMCSSSTKKFWNVCFKCSNDVSCFLCWSMRPWREPLCLVLMNWNYTKREYDKASKYSFVIRYEFVLLLILNNKNDTCNDEDAKTITKQRKKIAEYKSEVNQMIIIILIKHINIWWVDKTGYTEFEVIFNITSRF